MPHAEAATAYLGLDFGVQLQHGAELCTMRCYCGTNRREALPPGAADAEQTGDCTMGDSRMAAAATAGAATRQPRARQVARGPISAFFAKDFVPLRRL